MKRCPTCGSTFTDDSLRFCLQDGASLLAVSEQPQSFNLAATLRDDEETLVHRSEPPPTERFDLGAAPTVHPGHGAETVPPRSRLSTRETSDGRTSQRRTSPVVIAVTTAVVVLFVVLTGFGIVYLLRNKAAGDANTSGRNTPGGNAANPGNTNGGASADNVNRSATEKGGASPLRITATASSTRQPLREYTYVASNVLDGSLITAWIEGADGPGIGEWIRCDFGREVKLRRILITPGYFKTAAIWSQNNRLAAATFYFSDGTSRYYNFADRMQEQPLDTGGVKTRWVKMVIDEIYPGSVDSEDTAISQMTFDFQE